MQSLGLSTAMFFPFSSAYAESIRLLPVLLAEGNSDDGVTFQVRDLQVEPPYVGFDYFSANRETRALFEYSLSALPAGSEVSNASLTVRVFGRTGDEPFEVSGYVGNGTLQGVKWASEMRLGGPFAAESVGDAFTADAKAVALGLSPGDSVGFVFRMLPCRPGQCGVDLATQFVKFSLAPELEAAYFPVLTIEYTTSPVPEIPIWMFLLGSLPPLVRRVRRRGGMER